MEVEEVVDEADLEAGEAKEEDTGLTSLVISDMHSQYQVLIVWASGQRPWSMVGLPMQEILSLMWSGILL